MDRGEEVPPNASDPGWPTARGGSRPAGGTAAILALSETLGALRPEPPREAWNYQHQHLLAPKRPTDESSLERHMSRRACRRTAYVYDTHTYTSTSASGRLPAHRRGAFVFTRNLAGPLPLLYSQYFRSMKSWQSLSKVCQWSELACGSEPSSATESAERSRSA